MGRGRASSACGEGAGREFSPRWELGGKGGGGKGEKVGRRQQILTEKTADGVPQVSGREVWAAGLLYKPKAHSPLLHPDPPKPL